MCRELRDLQLQLLAAKFEVFSHHGGDHFGRFHDRGFDSWGWDGAWPLSTFPDAYDDEGYASDAAPSASSPTQYWYYCQNPAGYYPYVTSCTTAWQPVPAG